MHHSPTGLDATKMTNTVVFCDPLNNEVTGTLKSLADIAMEGWYHVLHIPTQPNGWDCGYYVLNYIQMLVEEFIQGLTSSDFVSII